MQQTCHDAGVPVEDGKTEGPLTTISFLGMELDTIAMEIRLPADKLRLQKLTREWQGRKAGSKREFLSLIGILQHAAKAVRQGRSFLRRLIDLSTVAKQLDHFIRLNQAARSDIRWWYEFAESWNGTSMIIQAKKDNPDLVMTSDASGSWGCGAFFGKQWFMLQWPAGMESTHITTKELIPIVIGAAIWGRQWSEKVILCQSDNAAVVAIINSGVSGDAEVMHLIRCLVFIAAKCNFIVTVTHVSGHSNKLADALSRNRLHDFKSYFPQAQAVPTPIPPEVVDLLILSKPDWTQQSWTRLWSSIFERV